jgi:hypothetical protein
VNRAFRYPNGQRFDAQISSVEPASYAKLGRLQINDAGPELLLEIGISGSLHVLIDSGASVSVIKPGIATAEI